jgi:hypothetical protein
VHVYLASVDADAFIADHRARSVADREANVVIHIVDNLSCVHGQGRAVPLVVAWLDLEDDDDRAARLLLTELKARP